MKRRRFLYQAGMTSWGLALPKWLKHKRKVGLITPGSPISDQHYQRAIENVKALGLEPYHTDRIFLKHGYLAGRDSERIQDLYHMIEHPDVSFIWCIRGGYGCTRLLPLLDYRRIKKQPKAIMGYSDITALLNALYTRCDFACFHGPVASSELSDYSWRYVKSVFNNQIETPIEIRKEHENSEESLPPFVIKSGQAEGKLVGGNLSLLAAMVGTPFEVKLDNSLLFIEEVGERPYRVDRMLTQLLTTQSMSKCKGIILGEFADCEAKPGSDSLNLTEVLNDRLATLDIPSFYGLTFGHIDHHCVLPIGARASMNTDTKSITLL